MQVLRDLLMIAISILYLQYKIADISILNLHYSRYALLEIVHCCAWGIFLSFTLLSYYGADYLMGIRLLSPFAKSTSKSVCVTRLSYIPLSTIVH